MNISATILAAGSSQRMGDNKLLLPFQDNTLINVVCKTIIDSYLKPVFVVTGFENKKVLESLPKSIDKIVYNEDWSRGMATSINKAISSLPNNIDGNMIVLGDMPLVTVKTINNLHQVFLNNNGNKIIYADYLGKQANPVIFPRKFFDEILHLNGDKGCKKIIYKNRKSSIGVPIDSSEVIFDCDTKDDYSDLVSMKIDNV
ncbi:MAG: nucleotidyltransferase family protein [Candidatus Neomarinimicrobiota bacterium]|nr:nucleotidyltransferase family protein [Candidatus Neomarinimicrobiota bacterium]